jgi:hypothetical protein
MGTGNLDILLDDARHRSYSGRLVAPNAVYFGGAPPAKAP